MGEIITKRMIDDLIERTEALEPDLEPVVKPGDWVTIEEEGRGKRASEGHVAYIDKLGQAGVRFADRETQPCDAGFSYPVGLQHISQIWRKFEVVKRDEFEFEGKTVQTTSVGWSEWRRVK